MFHQRQTSGRTLTRFFYVAFWNYLTTCIEGLTCSFEGKVSRELLIVTDHLYKGLWILTETKLTIRNSAQGRTIRGMRRKLWVMSEYLQMDHEVFGLAPKSSKFVKLIVYSHGVIKTVQSLEFTCQEWSRIFPWSFRLRLIVVPGSSPKMFCVSDKLTRSASGIFCWTLGYPPEGHISWKWCTTQEWPNPLSATKKIQKKNTSRTQTWIGISSVATEN